MTPPLTLLTLSGIGVPPFSARGLTQTLEPIDQSKGMTRTINGGLLDLSGSQFQKYKSNISGTDQTPPAVDGVWPGKIVTVDCISELCYPETGAPQRMVVPGSTRTESGFTFYRPRLTMRVVSFTTSTAEWEADVSWSMDLEEQ